MYLHFIIDTKGKVSSRAIRGKQARQQQVRVLWGHQKEKEIFNAVLWSTTPSWADNIIEMLSTANSNVRAFHLHSIPFE